MSSQDKNLSMSFDFFKKRKKINHSRSKHDGYSSPPLSTASLSESLLNGSQNGKYSNSNPRRGTFRGILSEHGTPPSQKSYTQQSNTNDDVMDYVPEYPDVDVELCKPYNYILWARDQMVFGNEKIVSMNNLEQMFISQLKEMEENVANSQGVDKLVNSVIYSMMKDTYNEYSYLLDNGCQYCHYSSVYLNSYVFLRPLNLTNFSFVSSDSSVNSELDHLVDSVNIEGNLVAGPVFVHDSLMPYFEKNCEFLPSKVSSGFDFKYTCIEYDYLPNLVCRVLHERAAKQLVAVKSNIDIPFINLSVIEGYSLYNLKSGEKCWLPIYISERLSHEGLIIVELPSYLTKKNLRQMRKDEKNTTDLQKLPSDYFFEIAHIFTESKIFRKIYVPNLTNKIHMYNYISKVAGIVEDIRYIRLNKIRFFLENLPISETVINLNNLQYSETYLINHFLSGYCSFGDKSRKMRILTWAQTDHLIRDIENTLMDSANRPLL